MTRKIEQEVLLPDGKKALEVITEYIGGSETQRVYDYFVNGKLVDTKKEGYITGYWGEIEKTRNIDFKLDMKKHFIQKEVN